MSRISLDARFYTLDPNNTNYMKKVTFFFYEKKNMSHSHLSGSGHWWRNDGVLGANLNSTKKLGGANKYLSFQAFFSGIFLDFLPLRPQLLTYFHIFFTQCFLSYGPLIFMIFSNQRHFLRVIPRLFKFAPPLFIFAPPCLFF